MTQNAAQSLLQDLPAPVRKTIYVLVALLGFALGILQAVDVTDIGPITMTQALAIYAFVSPVAGVVAVANVSKPPVVSAGLGSYAGVDHDLSAFEPVGAIDEVYAEMNGETNGETSGESYGEGSGVREETWATS